ncbi:sensor histidine kinase [Amycolatopsis regifaucium]|uniref:histidine kinase n=1 Tax=Amycolatopsis regifaucium TaxID=546365 RepID=A0A154MP48_9PSEU|nr:sensor domain-containing protein [Amycolatopsis regifaucium]KZB86081.1 histidine kinase [Amycolatopsis regifaucium]OKA04974.1 histidine kinase [Amycolatopsis regifaucium]SFH77200.1 Signal transduction histidine kinase [Amycolatopsis regifaucium]
MITRLRSCWSAIRFLAIGAATSMVSWFVLVGMLFVLLMCPFGVGIPAVPHALKLIRYPVNFERRRAARLLDEPIPEPYRSGNPVTDPASRRDLTWLVFHAATGFIIGIFAIAFPLGGLRQVITAFIWPTVPGGVESSLGFMVTSWPMAALSAVTGVGMIALIFLYPRLARWQAVIARKLLAPAPGVVLTDRVVELAASRAAALEAHGAELRRLERDLHDGTQARIAAVVLQLGIAESIFEKNPEKARELLGKAQDTATGALAELRTVVRSIYPPLLTDRGLDGAVTALADRCPVPCTVDVRGAGRRPAAVEAAAYFVVAEMLTNITKHSGAEHAWITLAGTADTLLIEIRDDGHGGADEDGGSGLSGIRKRAEAFDGTVKLSSPAGGPTVVKVELPCGS